MPRETIQVRGVSLAPGKVIVDEFDVPLPGPGEVLVAVKAAGICRADLSLYHGRSVFARGGEGNVIVGHELCGVVERIGPGTTGLIPGDHIAAHLFLGCQRCAMCRAGYYQHCESARVMGFDVHGADAEYACLPAINCLSVPERWSFERGVVSTDAVGTLWNVLQRLNVCGSDNVAIFGAGPMGVAGVMVAKGLGARVVSVDRINDRLEWAKSLGADFAVHADDEEALVSVQATVGPIGVVLDCTGNSMAQKAALDLVAVHGRVGLVGAADTLEIKPKEQFIRKQLIMSGGWYFNASHHERIVRFIDAQALPIEGFVTHRFGLEQAERAFTMFDAGKTGKVMLHPSG